MQHERNYIKESDRTYDNLDKSNKNFEEMWLIVTDVKEPSKSMRTDYVAHK